MSATASFEAALRELARVLPELVREEVARAVSSRREAESPPLMTVAKYAEHRDLGESTVRAMIADGRLEAVRVGRAVRIPANAPIGKPVMPRTASTTKPVAPDAWAANILQRRRK